MGESHENLLKAVRHYQESLDKYTENRNDSKLLHYLERLYKLPIKVVHLEQTGVGRTVNGLRKLGGEVGDSAKSLVAKWKEMVVGEQEEEEEEEEEDDDEEEDGYQTGDDPSNDSDDREERDEKIKSDTSSSHRKSDSHRTEERDKEKKGKHNSKSDHDNGDSSKSNKEKHKHHKHNGHVSSSSKHKSNKRKTDESSSDEEISKKRQKKENSSEDEDRYRNKKKIESDSEEENKSKEKKHHRYDEEKKKQHKSKKARDSSSDVEDSHKISKAKEKHKENSSKDKHKSSKKDSEKKHEHNKKTKEKEKKSESSKLKDAHKVKEKSDDKKQKSSKSKSSTKDLAPNGIGSGSGASFAEALGMCEPSSSKNSLKKKSSSNGPEKKEKSSSKTEKTSEKTEEAIPKLLKEPALEPLDINISSLLPTITPNYRPLGNLISSDLQPKKYSNEFEALSTIMTSKNQRTKVYSGNKMGLGKVPSLFELCIRVLQDNIDALEYTGGVPYTVLKPILDKCNPNQLYALEHHNPYLIEDTDDLWRLHCQKEFRGKKREEFETWREMYLRCLDERDAKLKALTANIKQAQDKSLPVRTTKLAYVDVAAKPPRNIARKQAKNGTAVAERRPAGAVPVPNPVAARTAAGGGGHAVKPKKAPLMLKSITSFKNRFKR